MNDKLFAVPVREIIWALEREAADTAGNPQWEAASALRRMTDWQMRTLICHLGEQRTETVTPDASRKEQS